MKGESTAMSRAWSVRFRNWRYGAQSGSLVTRRTSAAVTGRLCAHYSRSQERFSNHGIHECISTPPDANLVCWVSEGSPGGFYLRSRCWIVRGLLADNEASPCSSTVTAITFWLFDDLVGEPGAAIARSAPSPFSPPRCKATAFRPLAFCEPENCDPAEKSRSVRPTASARPVVGCSLSQFCPCTSICQR